MRLLELEVADSIFDKFKGFLEILPKNKIKIKTIYDDSHVSYVSEEEQKDIEKKLLNKDCHTVSHSKLVKL